MDLSNANTAQNLNDAFAGESMANRKYLFFADVARKLGMTDLAKLFRDTANQETEHAFAHFRLMHPELDISDPDALSDEQKKAIAAQCLQMAIEGETYEYTIMYPGFAEQARSDRDAAAEAEFQEQIAESQEHAGIFREAAHRFGLLVSIEHHHAQQYTAALKSLDGIETARQAPSDDPQLRQWICRQCSMIYDPVAGDPDSGIAPGTAFEDIPDDWQCPICGAKKSLFVPYEALSAA